jgi:hypothetical protein
MVVKCCEVWLGEVLMGRSEASTSVVKWSEGLNKRVSVIIRRYRDHMMFAAYLAVSFIKNCHILLVLFCIIVYMVVYFVCFCLILHKYLLRILIVMYVMYVPFCVFCFIVLFCVLFVCKCVLYYCHRVSNQLQLTNVTYRNIPHHIKWLALHG